MGGPAAGGRCGLQRIFLNLGHRTGRNGFPISSGALTPTMNLAGGYAAAGLVSSKSTASRITATSHLTRPPGSGVTDGDQRASVANLAFRSCRIRVY